MESKNSGTENINEPSDKKGVTIGRDASGNVIVPGTGNTINVVEQKKRDSDSAKSKRTRHRGAPRKQTAKKKWNTTVIVAFFGFMGVVITALLTSPIIERFLFPTPVPSSTPTIFVSDTPFSPQTTAASSTPTALPTDTLTPVTAFPSPEVAGEQMMALLSANPPEGKAPLKVNFNARESYVKFPDGTTIVCGNTRLCSYTFKIQLNGQIVATEPDEDGVFSYKFGKKGQYFVSVTVCRGETCGAFGMTINVR